MTAYASPRLLPYAVTPTSCARHAPNVVLRLIPSLSSLPHLEQMGDDMKRLSEEKLKILAGKYGWSIARAKGYVAGQASRRSGTVPSTYALVGIDDYCQGFRAGFFVRASHRSNPIAVLEAQLVQGHPSQGVSQILPDEKPRVFLKAS